MAFATWLLVGALVLIALFIRQRARRSRTAITVSGDLPLIGHTLRVVKNSSRFLRFVCNTPE
jgi:hypothetical protein